MPPLPVAQKRVSTSNHELFAAALRAARHAAASGSAGPSEPAKLDESKTESVLEMFPSRPLDADSSSGLAPEPQSVLGEARGLDASELLALFNPSPELLPTLPAPGQQHPGVADVSLLVERWVRRVALGGDQRRGVAKLDIGAGRFAGAELVVIAEAGQVAVELSLPHATDPSLVERLRSRLERRGYSADVVVR